ncbi:hypothetical protein J6590_016513 [Homalodisca vitripennis]|nr:hypothetical protein J6590_016513 [Homalodisca vitripennis]
MVGDGTTISSSLFYELWSLRFGVRLAAKWQWPGQRIEQAGECRAVVGILGEGGITAVEGDGITEWIL